MKFKLPSNSPDFPVKNLQTLESLHCRREGLKKRHGLVKLPQRFGIETMSPGGPMDNQHAILKTGI